MQLSIVKGLPVLLGLMLLALLQFSFELTNNYIIITLYIGYLLLIFYTDKRFLLKYIYIIFYISTNIFGVFVIETNSFYLTELDVYSYQNNSLLLITIAHIVFIETIRILTSTEKKIEPNLAKSEIHIGKHKYSKIEIIKIILIVIAIVFLLLFLRVANNPFFVVGLDRFLYEEQYLPGILSKISNLVLYLNVFIAIYYFYTKSKKVLFIVLIVFCYLFWIGHKFSFFVDLSYLLFLPFIFFGSKKLIKKIFKGAVALIVLLLIVVSLQSYIVYDRDLNENYEYLKQRLAQQGQLWWATYGIEKEQGNNINEINDEVNTYFKVNIDDNDLYNSGIYKIMRLTTPPKIFQTKVYEKNSRYAYSTQSTVYYYFKAGGLLIFSIVSGAIYYFIISQLIKNIINVKIIASILFARLLIIFNRVLLQSDFSKLFSIEVLVIIGLLLFLYITDKKFTIRKTIVNKK